MLTLEFVPISYTETTNHSYLNHCHRNCENYSTEGGGDHVLGWLKVPWQNGHRYLRHSCIRLNGCLLDITPRWREVDAEFAIDTRMHLDPRVSDEFAFIDSLAEEVIPTHFDVPAQAATE